MNLCFIGVGSIAMRHIHNLRDLYGVGVNITALRSGKGRPLDKEEEGLIDRTIFNYEDMTDYDAIFITNPTSMHYETIMRTIDRSDAFFVEKPAFVSDSVDCGTFDKNGKLFYVACPLRYSNVIEYLKENLNISKVYSVRCICSSYLPEWRPGTDYRRSYSASRELGGGVSIDLIHEWDYLTYLFGFPRDVKSIITKKSALEIDSDDMAVYIAEYQGFVTELHLDYFGRSAMRKLEIFSEDDTIICDLIGQSIEFTREGRRIDLGGSRDEYQKKELEHFMRIVKRETESDNDLKHACRTLRLAGGKI